MSGSENRRPLPVIADMSANQDFSRKRLLYLLHNDREQILTNCFVSQLYRTLMGHFRVKTVSVSELLKGGSDQPEFGDLVLSVLKQRTWRRLIPFLARFGSRNGIFFYDQDPWEAYHDNASSPGIYRDLASMVSVRRYLVTSGWWADYIRRTDELSVTFVRMGLLPELCNIGPPYSERRHELGFQGTLHPHRSKFISRMKDLGLDITCLPSEPYQVFLKSIQNIGIFIHDEKADVFLNGARSLNAIWIKDIEVAGRGCFSVRNRDLDMESYAINEIPTVFPYDDEAEVPRIVEQIHNMSENERNDRIACAVSRVKERNDWMTVVRALQEEAA